VKIKIGSVVSPARLFVLLVPELSVVEMRGCSIIGRDAALVIQARAAVVVDVNAHLCGEAG
jgi:hypothetical protein